MNWTTMQAEHTLECDVRVSDRFLLEGRLCVPENAQGIVLFAHASGSGRYSPRNQFVAHTLRQSGPGTLLFDLLTREEEEIDRRTRNFRFNIPLLAERLIDAVLWVKEMRHWIENKVPVKHLRAGLFGADTGAAAALIAASYFGDEIGAVVSRSGRPDLAGSSLRRVRSPTLFIVGRLDEHVIQLNEQVYGLLNCVKNLEVVPDASHLFEEPGTLEKSARLAADWFVNYLEPRAV